MYYPKLRLKLNLLYKSKKTIKTKLSELFNSYTVHYSVTLDAWTALNKNKYLGVNIHYLNNEWVLNSKLLLVQNIEQNHAAKYLLQIFEECLEIYDIKDKILRYVFHTDRLSVKYQRVIA